MKIWSLDTEVDPGMINVDPNCTFRLSDELEVAQSRVIWFLFHRSGQFLLLLSGTTDTTVSFESSLSASCLRLERYA